MSEENKNNQQQEKDKDTKKVKDILIARINLSKIIDSMMSLILVFIIVLAVLYNSDKNIEEESKTVIVDKYRYEQYIIYQRTNEIKIKPKEVKLEDFKEIYDKDKYGYYHSNLTKEQANFLVDIKPIDTIVHFIQTWDGYDVVFVHYQDKILKVSMTHEEFKKYNDYIKLFYINNKHLYLVSKGL